MGLSPSAVPIRDAATVVLLRDSVALEVWLLTRVAGMAFASGMSVFAGGRVDTTDAALPWSGRDAGLFAADLGCDVELARSLVGAAVRETFEETGVLITTPAADLSFAQPGIEAGQCGFGQLLTEHGLAIDADALRPWSRWITPPGQPRRYDTRFFVAALPEGAHAADLTTESSTAGWVPVVRALAERDAGTRPMMPPTVATLTSLLAYPTVAEVLAAAPARSLAPIRPELRHADGRTYAELPDGTTRELS